MTQETRRRPHREAAAKAVRGARCAVCHRLVFAVGSTCWIDTRGRRLCDDCREERD